MLHYYNSQFKQYSTRSTLASWLANAQGL